MPPLVTFYGDDFTGSSAVLEILAFAGLPSALFLDAPSPAMLAKMQGLRAIGVAGVARSRDPAWMEAELPRLFRSLHALGAPLLHYKTCSTFDSAPHLGSIGKATEIGLAVTGADWAPLVVGAPAIGRWQVFGTLFAAFEGAPYRLDRHPVMARHPATPMNEADLCRHLDAQTSLPKAVVDWRALVAGSGREAVAAARDAGARIIAIDCFDDITLAGAGALLWPEPGGLPVFAVGSQGVEYALVSHWRRSGLLAEAPPPPRLTPAAPLLTVSGSCSPTTARQIAEAEAGGFLVLALDAALALDPAAWEAALEACAADMLAALGRGRHVLVATARGPDDPAVARFMQALAAGGAPAGHVHERIGEGLGRLVRRAREELSLQRAVVAGGDTSGHAMLAIGAEALEIAAPLAPGSPLMRLRSQDARHDGLEIALKGGQMGGPDLFLRAAAGDPA
jgi:uncharacterized protein YgbK (DUF1537 family)